jgi:flavin-dependent dehydrogenase
VVLASGKHDLRGRARLGGEQNDLVAFKQYWRLTEEQTQALRGHVELLLFPDGYGGLQLVEGGNANLCWVMRQKRVQWFRGDASLMLFHMIRHCRLLDERLKDASTQKVKPLAVSAIPYGMVRRETEPGLWCVGDQAAVIPSFTGDGMALALRSGMLAAETLVRGEEANAFQRAFACEAERQVRFAVRLSRWMVEPRMQKLAVGAAQWVPGMMPLIARRTRLRVS